MIEMKYLTGFLSLLFPLSISAVSLTDFLDSIVQKNTAYQAADLQEKGGKNLASEKNILISPHLFANWDKGYGYRPADGSLVGSEYQETIYNVGVEQKTPIGLDFRALYGSPSAGAPSAVSFLMESKRPVVDMTLSLWRNGFGSETRALMRQASAAGLRDFYEGQYNKKLLIQNAENTYWMMVIARETVLIRQTAFENAEKSYRNNQKKASMNLGDKSDALQAKSVLKLREMEVLQAKQDLEATTRYFNTLRGQDLTDSIENLDAIPWKDLENFEISGEKKATRLDIKVAEMEKDLKVSQARLQGEKNAPQLNLVGSYAFESEETNPNMMADLFSPNRDNGFIGIRFSIPLAPVALVRTQRGAQQKAEAAKKNYEEALKNDSRYWENLVQEIQYTQMKLKLSQQVLEAQEAKVKEEHRQFDLGRSSTFQVLTFEQDKMDAEIARLSWAARLLALKSEFQLYQGEDEK